MFTYTIYVNPLKHGNVYVHDGRTYIKSKPGYFSLLVISSTAFGL